VLTTAGGRPAVRRGGVALVGGAGRPGAVQRLCAAPACRSWTCRARLWGQAGCNGRSSTSTPPRTGTAGSLDPDAQRRRGIRPRAGDQPGGGPGPDLLTVLTHEIGHVLGRPDDAGGRAVTGNVMADHLPLGVRRINLGGTAGRSVPHPGPSGLSQRPRRPPEGLTAGAPLGACAGAKGTSCPLLTRRPGRGRRRGPAWARGVPPGFPWSANVAAILMAVPLTGSPSAPAAPAPICARRPTRRSPRGRGRPDRPTRSRGTTSPGTSWRCSQPRVAGRAGSTSSSPTWGGLWMTPTPAMGCSNRSGGMLTRSRRPVARPRGGGRLPCPKGSG